LFSLSEACNSSGETPSKRRFYWSIPMGGKQPLTHAEFSLVVEQITDCAVFLVDLEGAVASWNSGAKLLKRYTADEIIGKHLSCFYTPEDIRLRKPRDALRVAQESGRHEDHGWRVRKDGDRFWAQTVITRIIGEEGKPNGFVIITRDLTQDRLPLEQLRLSEQGYRLLVEGVKAYAISVLDPGGYVLSWNRAGERILGYRADEIIVTPLRGKNGASTNAGVSARTVRSFGPASRYPRFGAIAAN
jgi:PAS domain S-box-containing protein